MGVGVSHSSCPGLTWTPTQLPGPYPQAIDEAVEKLSKTHMEHITQYGLGNEARLTGKHETCDINTFRYAPKTCVQALYQQERSGPACKSRFCLGVAGPVGACKAVRMAHGHGHRPPGIRQPFSWASFAGPPVGQISVRTRGLVWSFV